LHTESPAVDSLFCMLYGGSAFHAEDEDCVGGRVLALCAGRHTQQASFTLLQDVVCLLFKVRRVLTAAEPSS
jgi:hypothetical protein